MAIISTHADQGGTVRAGTCGIHPDKRCWVGVVIGGDDVSFHLDSDDQILELVDILTKQYRSVLHERIAEGIKKEGVANAAS